MTGTLRNKAGSISSLPPTKQQSAHKSKFDNSKSNSNKKNNKSSKETRKTKRRPTSRQSCNCTVFEPFFPSFSPYSCAQTRWSWLMKLRLEEEEARWHRHSRCGPVQLPQKPKPPTGSYHLPQELTLQWRIRPRRANPRALPAVSPDTFLVVASRATITEDIHVVYLRANAAMTKQSVVRLLVNQLLHCGSSQLVVSSLRFWQPAQNGYVLVYWLHLVCLYVWVWCWTGTRTLVNIKIV